METTRPTLLKRLRDPGDQSAWREFDARYRELVLRVCLRSGLQAADAEDVRQVTMMGLARALPGFVYRPEVGRFRDYLGTVVRNAIRRHRARQGRGAEVLVGDVAELSDPADGEDAWSEGWNEEWKLHHYRLAMARVRASFRPRSLAVFDGLLEGRTGEELAREHGMTPEAVYKVKQRIRDRLRELIARQLREEEWSGDGTGEARA